MWALLGLEVEPMLAEDVEELYYNGVIFVSPLALDWVSLTSGWDPLTLDDDITQYMCTVLSLLSSVTNYFCPTVCIHLS